MKILLADFNSKVDREEIFKPKIVNENLHKIDNDNRVKFAHYATARKSDCISTMFPHCNIRKVTCIPHDGKTHNQIDHI
jgi:hypothetical protein